jgi:AcrR family transcriptional regulator
MNEKEEAVLTTATRLFCELGYHAVGVDTIVAEANVAKMTFYKYFPSKENLIEKVLLRRDQQLRGSISAAIDRARTPTGKLKAVFDWYEDWFRSPDFHGCMFIKVSEEFPRPGSSVRLVAQGHKTWLADILESILTGLRVNNPGLLSQHLVVILDGLTVKLNMYDDNVTGQVRAAWRYTQQLIEVSGPKAT